MRHIYHKNRLIFWDGAITNLHEGVQIQHDAYMEQNHTHTMQILWNTGGNQRLRQHTQNSEGIHREERWYFIFIMKFGNAWPEKIHLYIHRLELTFLPFRSGGAVYHVHICQLATSKFTHIIYIKLSQHKHL